MHSLRCFILAALLVLASVCEGQTPSTPTAKDSLLVTTLSPATFVDGVETEVEVTVAYELASHPEALVELGANTLKPQMFSTFATVKVSRGAGTVTLKGKITPRF